MANVEAGQKQLWLQSAPNLMLNNGLGPASAAFEVGYDNWSRLTISE
jgi:hypothetical protein